MSYHGSLGLPPVHSTSFFAEGVDPYAQRFGPPGAIYSPYGWGPDFNIGMPLNYTHHLDYVREPIPGARRVGPMYDELSPYRTGTSLHGLKLQTSRSMTLPAPRPTERAARTRRASMPALDGILAVL